jgi:mono/diheme cytochrome c family protein
MKICRPSVACATAAAIAIAASTFGIGRVDLAAQPGNAGRGRTVYDEHCAICHGASGAGDGPAASHLIPRPRDFSAGKYKLRTTDTGSVPTDDDLDRSIRQGLYGTSMPAWDKVLADADLRAVLDYVKTLSPRFRTEMPKPISVAVQVPSSPESLARGKQVFDRLQCAKCHGTDGRGTGAVTNTFQDDWRQPLRAADLTEPWTFHGGATARDLYLRLRTGMSGTPMPSFAEAASDGDLWDLANYVVSLGRKPVWSMSAEEINALYARLDEEAKADPVERGAELVETLDCTLCHSPVDENKRELAGLRLAGGLRFRLAPFGDYVTGNLTSDRETGLGNWSDDEIKRVITRGTLRDGTRLLPYPMDWASFSTMKADDLNAIVAYLRTVPPVSNRVPRPSRPFLAFYLWEKFRMVVLGWDPPISIFAGNAGTRGGVR